MNLFIVKILNEYLTFVSNYYFISLVRFKNFIFILCYSFFQNKTYKNVNGTKNIFKNNYFFNCTYRNESYYHPICLLIFFRFSKNIINTILYVLNY